MKIMLDTNILVSVIFFPSKRTRSFLKSVSCYDIVISQYSVEELYEVTNRKFPDMKDKIDRFFEELPFELLPVAENENESGIPKIRDIKDVPILVSAILSEVDILITGDNDFLVLQTERPEILTMAEFEAEYG